MSYQTIIQLTDTLTDTLEESTDLAEAFDEAYGELEELLDEVRDASYHLTTAPEVQDRFVVLETQLAQLSRALQPSDYHEQTWQMLGELRRIAARVTAVADVGAADSGPVLDLSEAGDLLRSDPAALLAQAERELRADPESVVGQYLKGAAALFLERPATAIAAAEALAVGYPARHVNTIAAAGAAMQGRLDEARTWALRGMHRRLEARRPQHWHRIPGLRTLSDTEAEAIRQANVHIVQHMLHWTEEQGWPEAQRFIFTGLLAPSLTQARHMLEKNEDDDDAWATAARCGLARCARWRCAFQDAAELLEGITLPFAVVERDLLARDRSLIQAGELELSGFGVRLHLGRTVDATGFALGDEDLTFTEYSDRDEAQVADLLKDHVASWISTGFRHAVLRQGPLPGDEDGVDSIPEPEPAFDVDQFFGYYNDEDLSGISRYADAVISTHPQAPVPWAAKSLVHLIQGRWDLSAAASKQGVLRSGCRALASPQVLLPLSEDNYGQALSIAMDNLSLRLRSATPETPLSLPGYPHITRAEGELLDQIEHNTWRMAEELIGELEPEAEEQALELRLIAALIVPNPATTMSELEGLMPELEASLGLQAAGCVALARWRRHEGDLVAAGRWLDRADRLIPGLSYTRDERRRLERDHRLVALEEVTLRGFGMTIEVQRDGRLLHRHFTPDRGGETHALTGWVEEDRPNAPALALRDVAVSWLESGFQLLADAPGE